MNKLLTLAVILIAAVFATPERASAQCGSECHQLFDLQGNLRGYGCISNPDVVAICKATSRGCTYDTCGNAMLFDQEGAVLASAPTCTDGKHRAFVLDRKNGSKAKTNRALAMKSAMPARVERRAASD